MKQGDDKTARPFVVGRVAPGDIASFGAALRRANTIDPSSCFDDLLAAIDRADLKPR